jgi:hypothetical protein
MSDFVENIEAISARPYRQPVLACGPTPAAWTVLVCNSLHDRLNCLHLLLFVSWIFRLTLALKVPKHEIFDGGFLHQKNLSDPLIHNQKWFRI